MTPTPTQAERHQLGVCAHEAAHAVVAALWGQKIASVEVLRGGPRTDPEGIVGVCRYAREPDSGLAAIAETRRHLVAAAGSVAEAVWHHGPRPTLAQIDKLFSVNTSDRSALRTLAFAKGDVPRPREVLPTVLRCWPAIADVGRRLFIAGSASQDDVLGALGVTDGGGATSVQLAAIRNGRVPVPLKGRPAVPA